VSPEDLSELQLDFKRLEVSHIKASTFCIGILSPVGEFDRELGKRTNSNESPETVLIVYSPKEHQRRVELFDLWGARGEKSKQRFHPTTVTARSAHITDWVLLGVQLSPTKSKRPEKGATLDHPQCQEHFATQKRELPEQRLFCQSDLVAADPSKFY
jgi:hypothetical protein